MKVALSHAKNPDITGGYWSVMKRPAKKDVEIGSFAEASKVCREFIKEYELGGGNWTGGTVISDKGEIIARVSYNGRVWDNDGREINISGMDK